MLAALSNEPADGRQWAIWSRHHRDSHDRIRAAIQAQGGPRLTDYIVEPMRPEDPSLMLQNNSQLHIDMANALGLQSTNLQDVDFKDPKQLSAWIGLHLLEHRSAELALGL